MWRLVEQNKGGEGGVESTYKNCLVFEFVTEKRGRVAGN